MASIYELNKKYKEASVLLNAVKCIKNVKSDIDCMNDEINRITSLKKQKVVK